MVGTAQRRLCPPYRFCSSGYDEIVWREALAHAGDRLRIVRAELGTAAGLIGAGLVAFDALD